jgi:hypothetical protein
MGVNQSGEHEEAGEIHLAAAMELSLHFIGRPCGHQFGAIDGKGA